MILLGEFSLSRLAHCEDRGDGRVLSPCLEAELEAEQAETADEAQTTALSASSREMWQTWRQYELQFKSSNVWNLYRLNFVDDGASFIKAGNCDCIGWMTDICRADTPLYFFLLELWRYGALALWSQR